MVCGRPAWTYKLGDADGERAAGLGTPVETHAFVLAIGPSSAIGQGVGCRELTQGRICFFATLDRGRHGLTYDEFNAFCGALPAATCVVQWGGAHVWRVGSKVFAIGGWGDDEPGFTFKVTELSYEILKGQPGLRPAPDLASRGMKWIQQYAKPGLSDDDLKDYLRQSHHLVSLGLAKKKRKELGLD